MQSCLKKAGLASRNIVLIFLNVRCIGSFLQKFHLVLQQTDYITVLIQRSLLNLRIFAVFLPGAKFKVRIGSFICSSLEADASLAGPFRHPVSDCLHRSATPSLNETDFISLACANQIGSQKNSNPVVEIWSVWLGNRASKFTEKQLEKTLLT